MKGLVPPLTETVAAPLLPPLQETWVVLDTDPLSELGCDTVAEAVVVHPLASVTVAVYVPAARPEAVADVPPDGDHE